MLAAMRSSSFVLLIFLIIIITPETATSSTGSHCLADVIFLIDGSSSVNSERFHYFLNFLSETIDHLPALGPEAVQIGVVQFAEAPYIQFLLGTYESKEELRRVLQGVAYIRGTTNVGVALLRTARDGFIQMRGDRKEARDVIVVMTDGGDNGDADMIDEALETVGNRQVDLVAVVLAEQYNSTTIARLAKNAFVLAPDNFTVSAAKVARRILPNEECWANSETLNTASTQDFGEENKVMMTKASGTARAWAGGQTVTSKPIEIDRNVAVEFSTLSTRTDILHPESVVTSDEKCADEPNDRSETNAAVDLMFLLDGSSSIHSISFESGLSFIKEVISRFANFGPNGLKVSLVQYNSQPYIEFLLNKHDCKYNLIKDISDTVYITGVTRTGTAIKKSVQYGFIEERGDRKCAPNVLVIVTDGWTQDSVQLPLQYAKNRNVKVLVVGIGQTDARYMNELSSGNDETVFPIPQSNNTTHFETAKLAISVNRLEAQLRQIAQQSSSCSIDEDGAKEDKDFTEEKLAMTEEPTTAEFSIPDGITLQQKTSDSFSTLATETSETAHTSETFKTGYTEKSQTLDEEVITTTSPIFSETEKVAVITKVSSPNEASEAVDEPPVEFHQEVITESFEPTTTTTTTMTTTEMAITDPSITPFTELPKTEITEIGVQTENDMINDTPHPGEGVTLGPWGIATNIPSVASNNSLSNEASEAIDEPTVEFHQEVTESFESTTTTKKPIIDTDPPITPFTELPKTEITETGVQAESDMINDTPHPGEGVTLGPWGIATNIQSDATSIITKHSLDPWTIVTNAPTPAVFQEETDSTTAVLGTGVTIAEEDDMHTTQHVEIVNDTPHPDGLSLGPWGPVTNRPAIDADFDKSIDESGTFILKSSNEEEKTGLVDDMPQPGSNLGIWGIATNQPKTETNSETISTDFEIKESSFVSGKMQSLPQEMWRKELSEGTVDKVENNGDIDTDGPTIDEENGYDDSYGVPIAPLDLATTELPQFTAENVTAVLHVINDTPHPDGSTFGPFGVATNAPLATPSKSIDDEEELNITHSVIAETFSNEFSVTTVEPSELYPTTYGEFRTDIEMAKNLTITPITPITPTEITTEPLYSTENIDDEVIGVVTAATTIKEVPFTTAAVTISTVDEETYTETSVAETEDAQFTWKPTTVDAPTTATEMTEEDGPANIIATVQATQLPTQGTDQSIQAVSVTESSSEQAKVEVECSQSGFRVTFDFDKPFSGTVYVKNHHENDKCKDSYRDRPTKTVIFEVEHDQCGVAQLKLANPKGISTDAVVGIMHHDLFVTAKDRGYSIQCFYSDTFDKTVETTFDIADLGIKNITSSAQMPACLYSLRKDTLDGPTLRYASIGDKVFHRWDCEYVGRHNNTMYGLKVHSCYAAAAGGKETYPTIDIDGCSVDEDIFGQMHYSETDLSAYSETRVFSLADVVKLNFECQISFCLTVDGGCTDFTQRNCVYKKSNESDRSRRERRTVGSSALAATLSIVESFHRPAPAVNYRSLLITANDSRLVSTTESSQGVNHVFCLQDMWSFWLLLTATLLSITIAVLTAIQKGCRNKWAEYDLQLATITC